MLEYRCNKADEQRLKSQEVDGPNSTGGERVDTCGADVDALID